MVEKNGVGEAGKNEGGVSLKVRLKMRQEPGTSMTWKLPFLWRTREINWRVASGT